MWKEIETEISRVTEKPFQIENHRSVGGGCINQGYQISGNKDTYFVKLNSAQQVEMFAVEALGLKQMFATQTIRIPKPIAGELLLIPAILSRMAGIRLKRRP